MRYLELPQIKLMNTNQSAILSKEYYFNENV